MSGTPLTQARLKELIHYNRKTGVMTWIKPTSSRVKKGDPVGNDDGRGYLQARIDGKRYRIHRLAWLWVYGKWPENHIDHKDRDRTNNRIKNLRDLTQPQNNQNVGLSRQNTSGFQGVSWSKTMHRWEARISINNRTKVLGYFATPETASTAYKAAKRIHHPTAIL